MPAKFSLSISQFPASLHSTLAEIDDEGNGELELDELTEVFTLYADMKKAAKSDSIALSTLPKELRPTLKVFDVDGDGTVGTTELARAAEMYRESKTMTKRLVKAVAILLLIMIALVGTIIGLTAHVIEEAKETKTDSSGITMVKGTDKPVASGSVVAQHPLSEAFAVTANDLDAVKSLRLQSPDGTKEFSYTITGWMRDTAAVHFYAARGDIVSVGKEGNTKVKDAAGATIFEIPKATTAGRHLSDWFGGSLSMGSVSYNIGTSF